MLFKKINEFVDHAQKRPRTKFAVVGKGASWRIYEGSDAAEPEAKNDETIIKASCRKNQNSLLVVVVGGTSEIKILKEKVFAAQLKKDKNSIVFKAMSSEDHVELEKILIELEGPLLEQVGRLDAVAREAMVPLFNQAKELAAEGELKLARDKLAQLKQGLPSGPAPPRPTTPAPTNATNESAPKQPPNKPIPPPKPPRPGTAPDANQEALKHAGNYHGAISAKDAEALLNAAQGPAWLLRYSNIGKQVVVSAKDDTGQITQSTTFDPSTKTSKTLHELAKTFDHYKPLTARVMGQVKPEMPTSDTASELDDAAKLRLEIAYKDDLAKIDELFEELSKEAGGPEPAKPFGREKAKAIELATSGQFEQAIRTLADVQGLIENARDGIQWRREKSSVSAQVGGDLGHGSFGGIKMLKSMGGAPTGLVLKVADPTKKAVSEAQLVVEETMYKKIGDHPNVARCLGRQKFKDDSGNDVEGLVLEAIDGGDVETRMNALEEKCKKGEITHEELWGVRQFTLQKTLQTLAFIHEQGVTHADIKPSNLMFDAKTGDLKILDFGIAVEGQAISGGQDAQDASGSAHRWDDSTADGSRAFASPDQFGTSQSRPVGRRPTGDIFSVGASAFWMGEGALSKHNDDREFVTEQKTAALKKTNDGDAQKKPGEYRGESEYVKFVNQLMHPDPAERLTIEKALDHPFMKDRIVDDARAKELITGIKTPTDTTGAQPDRGAIAAAAALAEWKKKQPEWNKKMADWTPTFTAALKAKGPNAPEIAKLLAQAIAQAKPDGDMDKAFALLAGCHRKATEG